MEDSDNDVQVIDDPDEDSNKMEEVDGDVDGQPAYIVEKVTDMRYKENRVEFLTTWQVDETQTWEPLASFAGEFDHEMVKEYVDKNPQKYNRVKKQAEKAAKGPVMSGKNWIYATCDDVYEEPVAGAKKEAARLANPNRLADSQEQFLLNFADGERASRSRTKSIIAMVQGEPTPRPTTIHPSVEKKTEAKKRGRKRKEDKEPESSCVSRDNSLEKAKPKSRRVVKSKKAAPEATKPQKKLAVVEDVIMKEPEASKPAKLPIVLNPPKARPGARNKKSQKPEKLNSSDSDTNSENEDSGSSNNTTRHSEPTANQPSPKRMEGGGNRIPPLPESSDSAEELHPEAARLVEPVQFEVTEEFDNIVHKPIEPQPMPESRPSIVDKKPEAPKAPAVKAKPQNIDVRTVLSIYDSEGENEQLLAEVGSKLNRGPPQRLAKQGPRYFSRGNTLDDAIQCLDLDQMMILFKQLGHVKSFEEVCRESSLHKILTITSDLMNIEKRVEAERYREMDKVFRMALEYLPLEILAVQDKGGNTLLHRAIHAKATEVFNFLMNKGSPLHIRNEEGMTAVETCVLMNNQKFLEAVIKRGGTFHYLLYQDAIPGTDYYVHHGFIENPGKEKNGKESLNTARIQFGKLNNACGKLRSVLIGPQLKELDHGPIVCFPRGFLSSTGFEQTIEFTIPENWVGFKRGEVKFMLVTMPVVWHARESRYMAKTHVPATAMKPPVLCDQECRTMSKKQGSIFFHATDAIINHFNKCDVHKKQYPDEKDPAFNPRVCTLHLHINPKVVLHFMACQLIIYKPLRKLTYPNTTRFNDQQGRPNFRRPDGNRHRGGFNHHRPTPYVRPANPPFGGGQKQFVMPNTPR